MLIIFYRQNPKIMAHNMYIDAMTGAINIQMKGPEVVFVDNGGSPVSSMIVANDSLIAESLTTTAKSGFSFGFWF